MALMPSIERAKSRSTPRYASESAKNASAAALSSWLLSGSGRSHEAASASLLPSSSAGS
uniref:Uncharacterized protein n=1 Tax=Arundo donax TaxID=35708 RepID=A0A0A9E6E0_ARUDO